MTPRWGRGLCSSLWGSGFMAISTAGEGGCFGLLPMVGVGGLLGYSSLDERVDYVLLTGELGFKVTSQLGNGWVIGYSPLGEWVLFIPLGTGFQGNLPLGKLVSHWLLHDGGVGYVLPTGELDFKVSGFCSSHWGTGFQCNFPLGKWVGHWSLPAG